jgi:hypothetical protein
MRPRASAASPKRSGVRRRAVESASRRRGLSKGDSGDRPNRGSRARKALAKIIKKAASIGELLTEHDQRQNLRVIREAKKATHRIYDGELKRLIEVPDHKTRLAAVALDLAYSEGKPIERQVQVRGNFEELGDLLSRIRASPVAIRELADVVDLRATPSIPDSLQIGPTVTGEEDPIQGSVGRNERPPDAEK